MGIASERGGETVGGGETERETFRSIVLLKFDEKISESRLVLLLRVGRSHAQQGTHRQCKELVHENLTATATTVRSEALNTQGGSDANKLTAPSVPVQASTHTNLTTF